MQLGQNTQSLLASDVATNAECNLQEACSLTLGLRGAVSLQCWAYATAAHRTDLNTCFTALLAGAVLICLQQCARKCHKLQ